MKNYHIFPFIISFFIFSSTYTQHSILDSAFHYEEIENYSKAAKFYDLYLKNAGNQDSMFVETKLKSAAIQYILNDYKTTFSLLTDAIQISKKIKNEELIFKANVQLANFYIMESKLKQAQKIFDDNRPISTFSPQNVCSYYHRKAFFHNQKNELDSAIYFSNEALEIASQYHLQDAKGTIFNELANIHQKKGDYQKAIEYYDKTCFIYKNKLRYYANAYFNKATIYYLQENYTSAIHHLKINLESIQNTNWSTVKGPIMDYLSKSYFALGDSLNGYKYLALYNEQVLETNNIESNKILNKLQVEYETEQKSKEILEQKAIIDSHKNFRRNILFIFIFLLVLIITSLLFYFNIHKKNKTLSNLLNENEFLMGEANHRIKNNLQLIVSLLAHENEKIENHDMNSLRSITSKIESISTLHQQLYMNEEKDTIELSVYLNNICSNLHSILRAKEINLNINLKAISYDINSSVYIGLLINELIINSIKHAFNNKQIDKVINLILEVNGKNAKLIYQDNGVGISNDTKPHLIHLLCAQLKQKSFIDNRNGFYFEISLNPV